MVPPGTAEQPPASSKDNLDPNKFVLNQENPFLGQEKAANGSGLTWHATALPRPRPRRHLL